MKFLKSARNRVSRFFRRFFFAIRRFFYFKYFSVYQLIAFKLLAVTTKIVRQLIIHQGKDPDYVAPPPPPAPEPALAVEEPTKRRPTISIPYVPSWVRASFKTLANHPVYQSRVNLNLTPNKSPVPSQEPLQVVLAPAEPLPVVETPVVTVETPVVETPIIVIEEQQADVLDIFDRKFEVDNES